MLEYLEDELFGLVGYYQSIEGLETPALGLYRTLNNYEVSGLEIVLHPPHIAMDTRIGEMESLCVTWTLELRQHPGENTIMEAVEILSRLGDRTDCTPILDHKILPSGICYNVKILHELMDCGSCG